MTSSASSTERVKTTTRTEGSGGPPAGLTHNDPSCDELTRLETGRAHRFSEYTTLAAVIPGSGAGVYTIWDDRGELFYVGVAGRNPQGRGLASRLRSHAS